MRRSDFGFQGFLNRVGARASDIFRSNRNLRFVNTGQRLRVPPRRPPRGGEESIFTPSGDLSPEAQVLPEERFTGSRARFQPQQDLGQVAFPGVPGDRLLPPQSLAAVRFPGVPPAAQPRATEAFSVRPTPVSGPSTRVLGYGTQTDEFGRVLNAAGSPFSISGAPDLIGPAPPELKQMTPAQRALMLEGQLQRQKPLGTYQVRRNVDVPVYNEFGEVVGFEKSDQGQLIDVPARGGDVGAYVATVIEGGRRRRLGIGGGEGFPDLQTPQDIVTGYGGLANLEAEGGGGGGGFGGFGGFGGGGGGGRQGFTGRRGGFDQGGQPFLPFRQPQNTPYIRQGTQTQPGRLPGADRARSLAQAALTTWRI